MNFKKPTQRIYGKHKSSRIAALIVMMLLLGAATTTASTQIPAKVNVLIAFAHQPSPTDQAIVHTVGAISSTPIRTASLTTRGSTTRASLPLSYREPPSLRREEVPIEYFYSRQTGDAPR